jgi:hypothetical protein
MPIGTDFASTGLKPLVSLQLASTRGGVMEGEVLESRTVGPNAKTDT